MSATESSIPVRKRPKNVIWLNTYYYTIPYNVLAMEVGHAAQTPLIKFKNVEDYFTFQFARVTDYSYGAFAVRFQTVPPVVDDGYELQFQFAVIGGNEDMRTVNLKAGERFQGVFFLLETFYQPYFYHAYQQYHFELKVIVNMLEYENLSNENRERHEHQLSLMAKNVIKSEMQLKLMCRILQVPALKDLFTGRQNDEWANKKLIVISRAARFANLLAGYFDMRKKSSVPLPLELVQKIGVILNNIFSDRNQEICDDMIHAAYVAAYTLGLDFVKDATRDLAFRRVDRMMLVAKMTLAADRFGDTVLFNKFATPLRRFLPGIKLEQFWIDLVDRTGYMARSLLHSLRIKEKIYELNVPRKMPFPNTAAEVQVNKSVPSKPKKVTEL